MISLDAAKNLILDSIVPMPVVNMPLLDALGMIAAGVVKSGTDLPSFDNSAMDGYAVRAAEALPAERLTVAATVMAGESLAGHFPQSSAIRIMTGAPIPTGFDAVIPFEELLGETETEIMVPSGVNRGQHIRFAGEDVRVGESLVVTGTLIRPAEISILAACGITELPVFRRPKVAILSTGDELVEFGQPISTGRIINSNAPAIAAAVREAGGEPYMLGIAADTRESLVKKVREGLEYDVLITTAGVSAGERDLVRDVLEQSGVHQRFWKVAVKPGGPTAFGMKGAVPVFSLPGNPVSSLLTFEMFARPALLRMMGHIRVCRPVFRGVLIEEIAKKAGKSAMIRLRVTQEGELFMLSSAGNQQTGVQKTLLNADALAVLPAESVSLRRGEEISFQFLNDTSIWV